MIYVIGDGADGCTGGDVWVRADPNSRAAGEHYVCPRTDIQVAPLHALAEAAEQ